MRSERDHSRGRFRALALVRFGFGLILLLAPERLLRALPHRKLDHPADAVARILGARHLLEALAFGRRRSRRWIGLSVAVDAIHAATAFTFGAFDERHRRLAWTNGITASALAAGGVHEFRHSADSQETPETPRR